MLKDLNTTPETHKMTKFDQGDMKRLRNKLNSPESLTAGEIEELQQLTETHMELLNRFSRLRERRTLIGQQLNQANLKCHEYKKAINTLTQKKVKTTNLEIVEETPCCASKPQLQLV